MKQRLVEPMLTEYLHRKASITKTPISGTFELSPLCNMDCKMCYIKMSKEKQESIARLRTNEEWLNLAKEARNEGMLFTFDRGRTIFSKRLQRTIHRTSQNGILHINKHQWNNDRRRSHRVAKKIPTYEN